MQVAFRVERGRRLERGDAAARQHTHRAQRAAVQQHAREARQIVRTREQARIAGDAAHRGRDRIVNAPPEQMAIANGGGRHACEQRRRWPERGARHPERREHMCGAPCVERPVRHALDDLAKHHVIDVAVAHMCAGQRAGCHRDDVGQHGGTAAQRAGRRHPGRQSRYMCKQLADRDAGLAVRTERGPVARGRRVEAQHAPLRELHDRDRRCHRLRQRRKIEDGIDRHRLDVLARRALAAREAHPHAVGVARHDHRAGKMAVGDLGGDRPIDRGGLLRRHGRVGIRSRTRRCKREHQRAGQRGGPETS